MSQAPLLVFGYGNPSRGDDALGPALVDWLRRQRRGGAEVELLTDFQLQIEHALGHPDFPAGPALDLLTRFLYALDREASLHLLGRWMTRRFLLRLLEVRMQLMDLLRARGIDEHAARQALPLARGRLHRIGFR